MHWALYTLTDWLGLVPIGIALGFAVLGLVQLIRRKSLLKVDRDILILGGFYIVVLAAYLLFETVVINFRPVLIDGKLEASYPSSTTMLALCVLPTAMIQLKTRIRGDAVRRAILGIFVAFTVFMVVGRLLSGVHWLSDIVGGVLLSAGLVPLYGACSKAAEKCLKIRQSHDRCTAWSFRPHGSLISAKSVPILYTPQILTIRARRIDAGR